MSINIKVVNEWAICINGERLQECLRRVEKAIVYEKVASEKRRCEVQ